MEFVRLLWPDLRNSVKLAQGQHRDLRKINTLQDAARWLPILHAENLHTSKTINPQLSYQCQSWWYRKRHKETRSVHWIQSLCSATWLPVKQMYKFCRH